MPNLFAYIVLLAWPIVIIVLFNKLPVTKAVIWSMLLSYMILPARTLIDLPLVPPIDKKTLPPIVMFAVCIMKYKDFKIAPSDDTARRLLLLFLITPIFTIATNADTLYFGDVIIPALTYYDMISITFNNICEFVLPFLIGRYFLASQEAHKELLIAIVIAFFFYSLPILWEIRMSPQLHVNFYGFFPHDFRQQMRGDGFRPVVFMGHGLLVAFFVSTALAAAIVLHAKKIKPMINMGALKLVFISVVLVLSKTASALIYGVFFFLALRFVSPKMHVRISLAVALLVLAFPVMRTEKIIPTEELVAYAATKSEERAQSLEYRFDNEDILLDRANLRKYFGWGTWGRNRVYDPNTGYDISVTDGIWIIVLGMYGYTGFFALFGLYAYVLLKMHLSVRKTKGDELSIFTSGICLIYAVNLFDLLPNSSLSMLTIAMGGALLGYAESLKEKKAADLQQPASR